MALVQYDLCPYEKRRRGLGLDTPRKDHVKRKKTATYTPRRAASEKTNLADTLILDL